MSKGRYYSRCINSNRKFEKYMMATYGTCRYHHLEIDWYQRDRSVMRNPNMPPLIHNGRKAR